MISCPVCLSQPLRPLHGWTKGCDCGRLECDVPRHGPCSWWFGSSCLDARMSAELGRDGRLHAFRDGSFLEPPPSGRARRRFIEALVRSAIVDSVMSS